MNQALVRAREALGMTQTAVARAAGISQNHYNQVEHGKTPGMEVAFRISSVLGVSVDDLFRGPVLGSARK